MIRDRYGRDASGLIMWSELPRVFEIALPVFVVVMAIGSMGLERRMTAHYPERRAEIWGGGVPLGWRQIGWRETGRRVMYTWSSDDNDDPILRRWKIVERAGVIGTFGSMLLVIVSGLIVQN